MQTFISSYYLSWEKRLLDCVLAAILLIGLSPLMAVVAVIILLDSKGPLLFHQPRMGFHHQVFTMFKFRIMQHHHSISQAQLQKWNEAPAPMFKMKNDPRYTRVGRFLTRTGVDELPQLINILKGEMSFVGPRPLPVAEAQALPASWEFRYQVKPGLLSEWAVSPDRYTSLHTWKTLEIKTLQQGSVLYDLQLMCRTLLYILLRLMRCRRV